eukprot:1534563-Karenia_brevis.AAC.1
MNHKSLWAQQVEWEQSKNAKIKRHRQLMDAKNSELETLKAILEGKEKEILDLEQGHAAEVRQMESVLEHLQQQTQALAAAQNPSPPPTAATPPTPSSHVQPPDLLHFGQTLKDILQQSSIDPSQQLQSIQSLVAHMFPAPAAAASSQPDQSQPSPDQSIIPSVVIPPLASPGANADLAGGSGGAGQQTGHTRTQSPVQLEEPAAKAPKA